MNPAIFLCIILGAVFWLDRVYLLQTLISRPIVMAPLLGIAAGNLSLGLLIGAALELIWLNAPPVGAFLPYDESFCAAVAVPVSSVAAASLEPQTAAGLALFLCLPTAFVGRAIDSRIRKANQDLLPQEPAAIASRLSSVMRKAVGRAFLMVLISLALCTFVLAGVVMLVKDRLPTAVETALGALPGLSIIIGLAGLAESRRTQSRSAWMGALVLGLAVVLFWQWTR